MRISNNILYARGKILGNILFLFKNLKFKRCVLVLFSGKVKSFVVYFYHYSFIVKGNCMKQSSVVIAVISIPWGGDEFLLFPQNFHINLVMKRRLLFVFNIRSGIRFFLD